MFGHIIFIHILLFGMSLLDPQLTGKVALVTGAARGIGRGCCIALGELGVKVVCCDLEDQRYIDTCLYIYHFL